MSIVPGGAVHPRSGLSKNQLPCTVHNGRKRTININSLARDNDSISPVDGLGHDRGREVVNESNLRLREMIHVCIPEVKRLTTPAIDLARRRLPVNVVK